MYQGAKVQFFPKMGATWPKNGCYGPKNWANSPNKKRGQKGCYGKFREDILSPGPFNNFKLMKSIESRIYFFRLRLIIEFIYFWFLKLEWIWGFYIFYVLFETYWVSNVLKLNKKYLRGIFTSLNIHKNHFGTDNRPLGRLKMASKLTKCLC